MLLKYAYNLVHTYALGTVDAFATVEFLESTVTHSQAKILDVHIISTGLRTVRVVMGNHLDFVVVSITSGHDEVVVIVVVHLGTFNVVQIAVEVKVAIFVLVVYAEAGVVRAVRVPA